ncbi:efflux RND transporter periplasmic adaptor subunit [candidate division KSB1 bacterium]|nr:efflux RND transporter periplasmic adaptor subunit [candidate division KSB1 bacterium]RQW02857.1 MAG: efflux RND transporter periplasmic adaptor subunit [candidate division KSB1 bacterium]
MKQLTYFFASVLILLFFVLISRCSKSTVVESPEKIVPVQVAAVQKDAISPPIHGSGMLVSKQQIRLSFKTGGIVEKINVREGQNVREGDVLARLDLDEIEAQVQQAESGYDKAQRDYERITRLFADSVVTLEQKQNVETQLNVAESNLNIARFNLEYSTIKAPSDGKILKRFVEPNELVGPGTPVFYFGSGREEWLLRIGLSDRDLIKVQLGDQAIVRFDAYPGLDFPAEVTEIAQAADPQNGTFEVEILLDAAGHRLAAGFIGQVTITPATKQHYTLIPIAALVEARGDAAAVFTIDGDSAVKIPVTLGPIIDDRIAILNGLEGSEKIVTTGAAYLKAGDKVKVQ